MSLVNPAWFHQAHFRAMYEPRQGPPRRLGAFAFSASTTECPAVTQRRPSSRLDVAEAAAGVGAGLRGGKFPRS
jgi:hypothetical protein